MPFKPGVVYDLDEETYHASRDSLSSSGVKTILSSPRRFRYELAHPVEQTDAMKSGSYMHALITGQDHPYVRKDWSLATTEGKARAAEAAQLGLIPIPPAAYDAAEEMAGAILGDRHAAELLCEGEPEVSVYAVDETFGVNCRGRIDWWCPDHTMLDFKRVSTADPSGPLQRLMAQRGFAVQQEHYDGIVRELGYRPEHFWFICVEPEPPYNVSVVELDGESRAAGRAACLVAYETYRDCMASDLWPTWRQGDAPMTVTLPRWARGEVYA